MKKVVVDTSVAVKWFVPEVHSDAAVRLLEPEIVLCAPGLIGPELANTLWKKTRRGEISRREADEILAAFDNLPLEIVPTKFLLPAAFEIAATLDRTVYDGVYVALAVAQECSLFTANRKFHSAVLTSPLAAHVRWVDDEP
jgi:predicted nucleic acid-binding protein